MKVATSAICTVALFVASVSAIPEAAPAPVPAPIAAAQDAAPLTARAERPREDDM